MSKYIQKRLGSLALLLGLGLWTTPAWAEGSRTWYPSGATGDRASLYQTGSPAGEGTLLGGTLKSRTIFRVYAQAGEYILLGSTATGFGNSDIRVFDPGRVTGTIGQETLPGTPSFSCNNQRSILSALLGSSAGRISSRAEELAGPDTINDNLAPLSITRGNDVSDSYVPCFYQAPSTGIYSVVFDPAAPNTFTSTQTGDIEMVDSRYFTLDQGNHISAWDVTVRSSLTSTTNLDGRLFFYYTYVRHGTNNRFANFSLYPVTVDGFRYRTDMRGLDPNAFVIFGNRSGFFDSDGVTPLYHNILGNDDSLSTITGGASIQRPQFPIFLTPPTINPQLNTILGTLGIPLTPSAPVITNASFNGNQTGNISLVSAGGTFTYTANVDHTYQLVISRDGNDFDPSNSNNRFLRGVQSGGTDLTISWDGKDNSGNDFPVGSYSTQLFVNNGEYHFPLIDAENSPNGGPTITLLNSPGTCVSGNCSTGFYNDLSYILANGTTVGTFSGTTPQVLPPSTGAPSTTTSGFSGFDTGGTQRTFTNSWGDRKGLDIWTYLPSTTATPLLEIISGVDYGDAPDTYGTDATAGNSSNSSDPAGAIHIIRDGIRLGTNAPDAETDAQTPLDGTGDEADEDGVSSFPTLAVNTSSYSVTVSVANDPGNDGDTSEPDATLTSWIDFDRDGIFQPDEAATATVADGTTSATLTWNNIGSSGPNINSGNTYARFRLTTDNTITASTPGGAASDGEVEDYQIEIAQDLSNKACPNVVADLWFANDESGSVTASEFNDSLDFLYQVSDQFVYDDVTGTKAGITGWGSNVASAEVIIPITETFGDPDDSGLISDPTPVTVDGDGRGLRELYDTKKNTSSGTRLDYATNYIADLIEAGNGRRPGVPQVAVILTDASSTQLSNAGSGGGSNWIAEANTLRNAGPDGTKIVLIIINEAATAYNNDDPNVRSTVDAVVGDGALFIATTYAEAADPTNDFITGVADTVCATAVSSSDPNLLLTKRITRINGQTQNGSTNLDVYVDDPNYDYDDNTLANPAPDPIDTENWPTPSDYLKGAINGGTTKPGDEIEYTIYFLSTGDKEAADVAICDRVPAFQTFVPDAFNSVSPAPNGGAGANRGILVEYDNTTLSYTNDANDDTAQYYPPGANLPTACDNLPPQTDERDDNGNPVDNGTVVVNLGDIPNADGPGTPDDSYGLIRFRTKVK